jgi:glucose-6-phosphate isomerase
MTEIIRVNYSVVCERGAEHVERLRPLREQLMQAKEKKRGYAQQYEFIAVPFDEQYQDVIYTCAQKKKQRAYEAIVVIGIGGSSLGLKAAYEALCGLHWNEISRPRVYFADTLDASETQQIFTIIQNIFTKNGLVLLVVVSKTGTTLESVAHLSVFLPVLQRYFPVDYNEHVVIISDKNSPLARYGNTCGCDVLTVPNAVGGRYSFFTAVGVFVLAVLGIDCQQLLAGARAAVEHSLCRAIDGDDAVLSACALYESYQRGAIILDYFVFSKVCASIVLWYRQLVGESLGKKTSDNTYCHLTPTVSVGSNDLHAVAQLYLGGLPPMVTQFLTIERDVPVIMVPAIDFDRSLTGRSYAQLMDNLFQAT